MIERRPLLAGTAALAARALVEVVGARVLAAMPSTNADVPKLNYGRAFPAAIRAPRIHWAQSLPRNS